jgi:hypothetical protein
MQNLLYRIRNSLSLANIISFSVGVGMALVGLFAPLGWEISKELAKLLTYIGLGLIALGVILAIWKFFKNPIEETSRIYSIISILNKMDKRLKQLVEKGKDEKIDWGKFTKTIKKITSLVELNSPEAANIDEAQDWIRKTMKLLEDKYLKKKATRTSKMQILVLPISRLLDRNGFGLKNQRQTDKQYLKLSQMVGSYFNDYKDVIDRELKDLIELHIHFSEASSNMFLAKHRINLVLGLITSSLLLDQLLSPSLQSDWEGFEDDANDILSNIRIDIGQYIKTNTSQENNRK